VARLGRAAAPGGLGAHALLPAVRGSRLRSDADSRCARRRAGAGRPDADGRRVRDRLGVRRLLRRRQPVHRGAVPDSGRARDGCPRNGEPARRRRRRRRPVVTVALWYDWRLAFYYGLALASAASTVVFVALPRRTDLPDAGAGDTDFLAGALSEWKLILAGVVLMGLTSFVWQGLFNFYELYMVDKGLRPRRRGTC